MCIRDRLPVIGIPLPFISYGGSALLMTMAAVGVVMSFARVPRSVRVGPGRSGAASDTQILDDQEAYERGLATEPERPRTSWAQRVTQRFGKGRE